MEKLKKYKTQIFNGITIFLILTFVIFPGLSTADTIANIFAGIGLLLLLIWGALALYNYVISDDELETKANDERDAKIDSLKETMKKHNVMGISKEDSKPKTKKATNKSTVKIDVTNAKGMSEIAGIVNPIAEGRVKVSVETPKAKPKTKKATTKKTK